MHAQHKSENGLGRSIVPHVTAVLQCVLGDTLTNTWQRILWRHIGHFGSTKDNILYSTKFSRVFNFTNFANFQLFAKIISLKIFMTFEIGIVC